jgi:hypothetical protein
MINEYQPDNWVVLKIENNEETIYKVLAGWSGGYLDGDYWRMNSGISECEEREDCFLFYGYSGSVYKGMKGCYKISMATTGVYQELVDNFGDSVTLMDKDTDWKAIDYGL